MHIIKIKKKQKKQNALCLHQFELSAHVKAFTVYYYYDDDKKKEGILVIAVNALIA